MSLCIPGTAALDHPGDSFPELKAILNTTQDPPKSTSEQKIPNDFIYVDLIEFFTYDQLLRAQIRDFSLGFDSSLFLQHQFYSIAKSRNESNHTKAIVAQFMIYILWKLGTEIIASSKCRIVFK